MELIRSYCYYKIMISGDTIKYNNIYVGFSVVLHASCAQPQPSSSYRPWVPPD